MYNPYQPNYFGNQQPQMQMQVQPQNVQPMNTGNVQNQNGLFVPVANENVAFNYPVAYGNTVIFKDENNPYIYIKKMGFSQLESPVFEKYHREASILPQNETKDSEADKVILDDLKSKIEALESEIETLNDEIKNLKGQTKKPVGKKKEAVDDD